jgi:hypothetical protein
MFAKFGKKAQVYIRRCTFEEFPNQHSRIEASSVWILVVNISDWHLRIPIWNGPQFFATEVSGDAAVMMTVLDCVARGGCQSAAVDGLHTNLDA